MAASTEHHKPSLRVIETIASYEGVDQEELEPPLYDIIDLEALDAVFESQVNREQRGAGLVRFTYNGYEVEVSSDGAVEIND